MAVLLKLQDAIICDREQFNLDNVDFCSRLVKDFRVFVDESNLAASPSVSSPFNTLIAAGKANHNAVYILADSYNFRRNVISRYAKNATSNNDDVDFSLLIQSTTQESHLTTTQETQESKRTEVAYAYLNLWLWFQENYNADTLALLNIASIIQRCKSSFNGLMNMLGFVYLIKNDTTLCVKNTREYFTRCLSPTNAEFIISCVKENFDALPMHEINMLKILALQMEPATTFQKKPLLMLTSAATIEKLFYASDYTITGAPLVGDAGIVDKDVFTVSKILDLDDFVDNVNKLTGQAYTPESFENFLVGGEWAVNFSL